MGYSYQRNETIIRSKTRELFGVGAVVTASSYLVLVVDFMLIGWILGADAVAAAGLCDSFVDIAEFPGFVISSSGPIAVGILMGKRQYRQADGVFTLSFLISLAGGILCWCLLPFCDVFGRLLAGTDTAIAGEAARYTFFVIAAAPFIALNLVISGFAILDNHSKLAMAQVVTANVVNIVLDIVLMKFVHMGVAGASAASMMGNIAGIAVGLPYLLSKKRTLHFTRKLQELRELCRTLGSASVSFSVDKASRIFSTLIVNLLLMRYAGSLGVALYAVYGRLKFVLRILAGGALQTISNLGSMLYGERDFFGIRKMLSLLLRYTYTIVMAVVIVLAVFSAAFLRSYGIDPNAPGMQTLLAFRLMLLCLPFLWGNEFAAEPAIRRMQNFDSPAWRSSHRPVGPESAAHCCPLVLADGSSLPCNHAGMGEITLQPDRSVWHERPRRSGLSHFFYRWKTGERGGYSPGNRLFLPAEQDSPQQRKSFVHRLRGGSAQHHQSRCPGGHHRHLSAVGGRKSDRTHPGQRPAV